MEPFHLKQGRSPIVLAQPHSGTYLPHSIWLNLTDIGKALLDTDWHIPRLYEGISSLADVTVVRANFSRYVIDANRDPNGESLYPGQNTTGLVPSATFDNQRLWTQPPSAEGIADRLKHYHCAYHAAIEREIERLKGQHAHVVIFDCHSIRSHIPHLFEGELPHLNIGTNNGQTCHSSIEHAVVSACEEASDFDCVLNQRFKGGWSTRHYGQPSVGVHAIQLEIAQRAYLESENPPFTFDSDRAAKLQKVLATTFRQIEQALATLD